MVAITDVEEYLTLGHEIRSFEVKGPGGLDEKAFCAKVARAAMAMGNLRDGGLVCIGIDESRMTEMQPGLDANHLAGWSDFDNVNDALARYSDPPVDFQLHTFTLSSGATIVVIEVQEFNDVPHLCKKDYPGELQRGMAYVRPRGKPQSVSVPTENEMRTLIGLATTKAVREFVRQAGEAGVTLTRERMIEDVEQQAFEEEASRAWLTTPK